MARIGYSSKVYERHEADGWLFEKQVETVTADAAELTYDDPGPAPPVELFSKGVAGLRPGRSMGWNASAVANLLFGALQIGLTAAGDGTALAGVLTNELVSTTVTAGASLIERTGSTGDIARDMMVAWDNSTGTPITLLPNQTHVFELKASSRVYGRGYGPRAENRNCLEQRLLHRRRRPQLQLRPQRHRPGRPRPLGLRPHLRCSVQRPTLQNLVGTFAQTELGTYPGNVATAPGQYP